VIEQAAFAESGFGGDSVESNSRTPFAFKEGEGRAEDVIFRCWRHSYLQYTVQSVHLQ
jgi:hypothetical protein